jgi:tetratricopeptide (TPR) repeat protein
LLLMDYWPLGRLQLGQSIKTGNVKTQKTHALHLVGEKIPLFLLTAVASMAAYITQQKGGALTRMDLTLFKIQIANALISYVSYIGKMIWPSQLAVFYPHPGTLPIWESIAAGLLLIFTTVFIISVWRRFPYLFVGWFWYLGTLVPVIGLVKVGSFAMADRYTYVPLIGIFIIIAWGVPELVTHWRHRKICLTTLATVVLTILMAMTWKQVGYWENSITLFEHTLKITSNNFIVHKYIGTTLSEQGRTAEAIEHYLQALRIKPGYASAHNNLGLALYKQGRTEEAIEHYLQALRIKPDYEKAHNNLGLALDNQDRTAEAIEHYSQALRIKPDYVDAHNNLGLALDKQGRTAEAIEHYSQALRIKPDYEKAHNNLAIALFRKGDIEGAIAHFRKALRIKPDHIHVKNNLKKVLIMQQQNK